MRTFTDLHGRFEPPLPDWGPPHPGEPAHGYVVRLGAMSGIGSVAVLLNSHGLNGRDIQPAECLEFALSFPISGKEQLIHATPVVSPTSVAIMGQEIRRRHWQVGRRRFCPACLAESPHHRVWWDMPAFARCPHHDLDVVDRDASGHPVPWWSASFTRAPTGTDLLRYGVPRRPFPRPSLESYVLARLGVIEAPAVPLLDGLSTLGDVLDAVEFVGRVALGGKLRSRPVVGMTKGFDLPAVNRAGYGVLARGTDALVALLHEVAAARAACGDGRGKRASFGWIGAILDVEKGSHVGILADCLRRVAVERGDFSPATCEAWYAGEAGWLPVPTLAGELGLTEERLRRLSEALGIHERQFGIARKRYRAFSPEQAALVRRTMASLLDRDGAADALGIPRGTFDALVAAGIIARFVRIGSGPGRDRFRPEDVAALAARLLHKVETATEVPDGHLRLADLKRTCKTDPARSVAAILKGYAAPRGRTGPSVGDLLVPDPNRHRGDGMRAARAALRTLPGLSRYQAATVLGCRVEVVDGLIDGGHLPVCSGGRGWRRIDEAAFDAFHRTWAPADLFAEAAGATRSGHEAGPILQRLGAGTLHVAQRDGSVAHMAERASARAALRLSLDPDDPAGGSLLAFEAALLRALARRGTFKLVGRSRGLTLSSAAGDLTVRIAAQPDRATVEVVLTRGARPPGEDHAGPGGRLRWREAAGRLETIDTVPAPELATPAAWPDLVARTVASTEFLRATFPQVRAGAAPGTVKAARPALPAAGRSDRPAT
ncbi:hypothetical protein FVE89_22405 [Methylobacterium sp. 2A]|jgi:hypothetical protein|uniref:TniQ family protein n=2 Tax=unclassified Methylobacterium TaxID=2615210 RepID=UPI0013540542|nr:TniQ family protein [Methylobacterium sp. 2A]MWV24682.1 hypothetical protein [Methylobacterium sp. 2A]